MAGFLDKFRERVVASVWKDKPDERKATEIDDKIALGVLMWAVAEADDKLLPEEEDKIEEILRSSGYVAASDIPLVLAAIRQAAKERVDLHAFTRELKQDLPYEARKSILDELFRVACADKEVVSAEIETIRKISGLFHISHKDFIAAKLKVKKEFGLGANF